MSTENGSALTATIKAGPDHGAPWVVVRADNPAQLTERLEAIVNAGVDGAIVVAAQSLARSWSGGETYAAQGQSPAVQVVASGLDGQVVSSTPTSPAPSAPAPQAQGAPAGVTVEEGRWGDRYEHNLPNAPQTAYGPAVKKTAKAKSGKFYSRWIDPRDKSIPSVYASGQRENPADLWEGEFAR